MDLRDLRDLCDLAADTTAVKRRKNKNRWMVFSVYTCVSETVESVMPIEVSVFCLIHPIIAQLGLTVVARALATLCLAEILHSQEPSPDNQLVLYCLVAQFSDSRYNPSFHSNKNYT